MNPNQSSNSTQQPVNPNPNVDRNDAIPPPPPVSGDNLTSGGQPPQTAVSKTPQGADAISGGSATTIPGASNPYVTAAPVNDSSPKNTTDTLKIMLGRWAKRAADATKKGQEYAGDMWQHLKTGPSITDAAVGRIAQGTKVLAEGGYDKIFVSTFQTDPNERFMKSYACYLSTSAGPIMGVIYISTAKLAFCSDNPLPYKVGEEKKWSYYKVVIPLLQLKEVQPSISKLNPAEKFIQVISVDDHEFWFMGFVYYESAVKNLQGALDPRQHSLSVGSSD